MYDWTEQYLCFNANIAELNTPPSELNVDVKASIVSVVQKQLTQS